MPRYCLLVTLFGLSVVAGCSGEPTIVEIRKQNSPTPAAATPPPPPDAVTPPEQEEAAIPESQAPTNPAKGKDKKLNKKKNQPEITPASYNLAAVETSAVKKIIATIKDSVDLGPTLVVWLVDRTTSARDIVREATSAAQDFYNSPEVSAWSTAANEPLRTAVIAFDDKAEFLIDPPSPDGKKVTAALENLSSSTASREMTFAAIKQALEKYQPFRTKDRREVIFVVVTDEAGDDGQVVDELVEPFRRHAIPVYAVGMPAPWGQSNPFAVNPKAIPASKDELLPTVGPESLLSERVDIESAAQRSGNRASSDLVDSGFGPFALERLCRASHGQFLALRGEAGQRGVNARSWPPGTELRFDPRLVGKYAPDYVSAAEYEKSLLENKAKAVLVEAAKVAKLKTEGQPATRFPKDADAKMAKKMSDAQQFAARNLPPIEHLHDLLIKGEADRAKLTSPRWQAEFDLAAGRILAMRARLDGYNSMLAALKRGKTFQKADSKVWVLDPADSYETESTIKKMADKAKLFLERVARDHAGTPWAKIAEDELKTPLGWTWHEAP